MYEVGRYTPSIPRVLIEAVQAYKNEESERILEDAAPLKKFTNSQMQ